MGYVPVHHAGRLAQLQHVRAGAASRAGP
jgi:hypothetical protein